MFEQIVSAKFVCVATCVCFKFCVSEGITNSPIVPLPLVLSTYLIPRCGLVQISDLAKIDRLVGYGAGLDIQGGS